MASDGKKADPVLIAVVVILIICAIFFIISLIIVFVVGRKPELEAKRSQLLAAGAMLALAIPMAVVAAILTGSLISQRSKGKDARGLAWAVLIISIITGILLVVSSIIIFVTANQINPTNADDARSLQAAGALSILGFVLFAVGFFLYVFRAYKKIPKTQRKSRREELFRTRKRTGDTMLNNPASSGSLDRLLSEKERSNAINALRELGVSGD